MKLIVGLGNPGNEYNSTRHNMGFFYIDKYAEKNHVVINKKKFNGLYCDLVINNEKVILLKPQSYINLSGEVIKKYIDYFNIAIKDILIICDDLNLESGKIRIRPSGSSGGHNGLKNIELMLNTKDYSRLRIGISNNKEIDTKDYVLSKIDNKTMEIFNNNIDIVCNIINDFFKMDMEKLMSKYNRK